MSLPDNTSQKSPIFPHPLEIVQIIPSAFFFLLWFTLRNTFCISYIIPLYYLTCLHVHWRLLMEVIADRAAIILNVVGCHVSANERAIEGLRYMQLLPTVHLPELITCSHPTRRRAGRRKSWKILANHTNNYNILFFDKFCRMLQNKIVGILETSIMCWKYFFSLYGLSFTFQLYLFE